MSNYHVHNGSSGYAYYVSSQPGQFVAAAVRKEVSETVAAFLNSLPEGVSAEEVLTAIGRGRPHGGLPLPADWKYGQTWSKDDPRRVAFEASMETLKPEGLHYSETH